jgi:predicted extracellular nuclease
VKRALSRLAVCLALVVACAVWVGTALAAGDVVISQVYGGGGNSGATYTNDFIELTNTTSVDIDLSGWSVQYASAGGTSWAKTNLVGTISAGGTYLIQEGAGAGGTTPLPSPRVSGNTAMSATAGKVALVANQATIPASPACPGAVVDLVGYGSASCFEGAASAPALTNTTAALRKAGGTQDTDSNATDFTAGAPAPHGTPAGGGGLTGTPLKIDQIQGSGQVSPHEAEAVQTTGVVTAIRSTGSARGFWLQDPAPDGDLATSEGIFVFTASTTPPVSVGDGVAVSGTVKEFAAAGDLPETELTLPQIVRQSSGNPLPTPIVIGLGGQQPPTSSITDGIAFDERFEGMVVQLNDIQAVSPVNSFGEVYVVPDNGAGASVLTPRGGLLLQADDNNPEKFRIDDDVFTAPEGSMSKEDVGARAAGSQVGVMDYAFSNYTIHLLHRPVWTASTNERETTAITGGGNVLTVATFNVENLAPQDPASKYAGLADVLVNRLQAPDIVALEEVQDNSGATDNGVVDSRQTLDKLRDAVVAAGGPVYDYRWIDPVNDQDGGQPGGNIRVAFFFRTDVPELSFAPGVAGDSTTDEQVVGSGSGTALKYNPGRIDPTSSAWSSSRKPLVGNFVFNGHSVFVVANHFNSKLGDDPAWGATQPAVRGSEGQRHQQANEVKTFVSSLFSANPDANVIVLGDLNDFQFSDTLSILEQAGLHALIDDLPLNERYSYVFDGNSQAIDHMLVGGGLLPRPRAYDPVHVNAEFAIQVSDHDPQVGGFTLDGPTVSANGPYTVAEGSSTTLTASGSDPSGGALTYRWDFDGDGVYETAGAAPAFSVADGPAVRTVKLLATAPDGATATSTAVVEVENVGPSAMFIAPASVNAPNAIALALTGATDPSAADTAAGFEYAFDCGEGFGAWSRLATATCATTDVGQLAVRGAIRDRDGSVTEYTATVAVTVTVDSLCATVQDWAKNEGEANSLCVKLQHGETDAFGHEVDAQTGKAFTADRAAILKGLAARL